MSSLYITAAQPNPRGKDTTRRGQASNAVLNEEWVEFQARAATDLTGVTLTNLTFGDACRVTGVSTVLSFSSGTLSLGQSIRVHTGRGENQWSGTTYHMFVNRDWFVWNNACGDRAAFACSGQSIDSAAYRPNVPEGELRRVPGTDLLEPAPRAAGSFR